MPSFFHCCSSIKSVVEPTIVDLSNGALGDILDKLKEETLANVKEHIVSDLSNASIVADVKDANLAAAEETVLADVKDIALDVKDIALDEIKSLSNESPSNLDERCAPLQSIKVLGC